MSPMPSKARSAARASASVTAGYPSSGVAMARMWSLDGGSENTSKSGLMARHRTSWRQSAHCRIHSRRQASRSAAGRRAHSARKAANAAASPRFSARCIKAAKWPAPTRE